MMFNSKIKASELIEGIKDEADIEYPIPDETWLILLNEVEQKLYSEIIKEQKKAELQYSEDGVYNMAEIPVSEDEDEVLTDDICYVFSGNMQLIKSTVASGVIFPDTWYINGNNLCARPENPAENIVLIYNVRPKLKTKDYDGTVRVPYHFLDLIRSKLRGEGYKLANEDVLAAKWLNDYNVLLENFKAYVQSRKANFGQ